MHSNLIEDNFSAWIESESILNNIIKINAPKIDQNILFYKQKNEKKN